MKKYIAMSITTAFVISSASAANMDNIPLAKTYSTDTAAPVQITKKVAPAVVKVAKNTDYDKKIAKLEKELKKLKKTVSKVKSHDAKDNIKWSVDFRTAHDTIEYTSANGRKLKNDSILSNRLWLDMAFAPTSNMIFKGRLSYYKAYGAAPAYSSGPMAGFPQRGFGYDKFDWVLNENLTDNELRVKEAYWLYMNDTFLGSDIDWTASFGRRPSTNGSLVSLRDDDKASSPHGHVINMEFDGASFRFGLEKMTGISGMSWKACLGRGLTNARARFNFDTGLDAAGDYTEDKSTLSNIDLAGFIFVPYDDGQYKVLSTYYRGFDVPGFVMANGAVTGQPDGSMALDPSTGSMVTGMKANFDNTGSFQGVQALGMNAGLQMQNLGNMDGAALSFMVDGVGEDLGDFADGVKLFASFGWSKSNPNNDLQAIDTSSFDGFKGRKPWEIAGGLNQMFQTTGTANALSTNPADYMDPAGAASQALGGSMIAAANAGRGEAGMLGSKESETGTSYWLGAQWPCLLTDDAVVGVEYNHGSKYWRPFTYGEDTLVGSKLATRGDAVEVYWTKQLNKAFSVQARYTKIKYDYTGSQGFFGDGGTPMSMDDAIAANMNPIEDAQDIRVYLRYRF